MNGLNLKRKENDMRWYILLAVPTLLIFLNMLPAWAKPVDTSKAVIHHTAGSKASDRDLTVVEIDAMHKARGWDGIGYHFLIRKDGSIHKGRPLSKSGAHAKGRNHYVGIALTGFDDFTEAQKDSLTWLLRDYGISHIEPHHEQCPGPGLAGIYGK